MTPPSARSGVRALGIDPGTKRIGLAISDRSGTIASPLTVLERTRSRQHDDAEIARIVRGRLTNPRWIAGMLGHGHRGVGEIAQGVDALYAFAASTNAVPSHLFDAMHEALFADEAISAAIKSANAAAAYVMAARLEDAIARGLWTPKRNAVGAELERWRAQDRGGRAPLEAAQ